MTQPQHRAWTMVASMFVTVAIVYGLSFDIICIFYNSLAKEFGLSRAKFSSLATSFSLSFLAGGLVAGWLLDRIGAQFVVVGGAMVVIAGLLVASAASSFNAMLLAYFLIGLGVSAATITSYMVVNNWFSRRTHTREINQPDPSKGRAFSIYQWLSLAEYPIRRTAYGNG